MSPYITECPYCGNRLRKRAPKLDREGRIAERRSRRPPAPSLTRLRRGEIPGIRSETRAYATIALVAVGVIGCLLWRTGAVGLWQVDVAGPIGKDWWRPLTAPFVYDNAGYALVALSAVALYGTLLERRHGSLVVLALFLLAGVGGAALTAHLSTGAIVGANGSALALLVAWAVPDLLRWRGGHDFGGDLIGTGVFGLVVALMPLVTYDAGWVPVAFGVVVGAVIGVLLDLVHHV